MPPAPADPAAQLPLFKTGAPARTRHARLRSRLQALLGARVHRAGTPPAAAAGSLSASSWPDSFFDADAGPGS